MARKTNCTIWKRYRKKYMSNKMKRILYTINLLSLWNSQLFWRNKTVTVVRFNNRNVRTADKLCSIFSFTCLQSDQENLGHALFVQNLQWLLCALHHFYSFSRCDHCIVFYSNQSTAASPLCGWISPILQLSGTFINKVYVLT